MAQGKTYSVGAETAAAVERVRELMAAKAGFTPTYAQVLNYAAHAAITLENALARSRKEE